MALGTSKTHEFFIATTATGNSSSPTSVRGYEFAEFEVSGLTVNNMSSRLRVLGSLYGTTFTTVTVVNRITNTASDSMITNGIYSLDLGGIGFINVRLVNYHQDSTPTVVMQTVNYI